MNQNTFCKNCHRIPSQCCCTISTEMKCNPHPNAPHGFLRQASHDAGRYVCECEWWSEKDYELGTLEEAEEFAKKRKYVYEWNGVSPAVNKQYTVEKCPWDEWKASKDIV